MKAYWGSGVIVPRIVDLGTRWSWVVSFTPRPLYPQRKRSVVVVVVVVVICQIQHFVVTWFKRRLWNFKIMNYALIARHAARILNLNLSFSPTLCYLTNYLMWSSKTVPTAVHLTQQHIIFFARITWYTIRMWLSTTGLGFQGERF
jgi:hypothetical protein